MFEATKPTKTKVDLDYLDGLDDILNPQDDFPIAGFDDEPEDEPEGKGPGFDDLPTSSAANTKDKTSRITPSDQMRDYMNRINPDAGAGEPDRPETPTDAVTLRTARDVPAVISNAMRASGTQSPEWHKVENLPGMNDRNIRGMGRNVFGAFTSTPQEEIKTIANVNGQGPNTTAEVNAVASWLKNNAEDLGEIKVDFGQGIPGYKPDVREFKINGVRFHVVRDPMGQYIYAYPDKDARSHTNQPRLREMIEIRKPTLFESLKWDEELDEAFVAESSLSKLLGKEKGGQNLVSWLHKRHKLSNDAEYEPAPFNKDILWKLFKSNPDNYVIVSAENGVAGIKPDENFIKQRTAEFAKKGKEYNPAGDATLPYNIIAFTDDGEQVDPQTLKPKADSERQDLKDPTVMKARMGKHTGRDNQNPDNVFNLLADQIGRLTTVWKSGFSGYRGDPEAPKAAKGSVERDKIAQRADRKAVPSLPADEAMQAILKKVRPVLKTLGDQAYGQIMSSAKRAAAGGNFEGGQKIMQSGQRLKQFLVQLDSDSDINIDQNYNSPTRSFSNAIVKAIEKASGSAKGTDEFNEWMNNAARGNSVALKPVLDALRDTLTNIPG